MFVRGVGCATSVLVRYGPLSPQCIAAAGDCFREVWLDVIHAEEKRRVFLCGIFFVCFLKMGEKKTSPQARKIVFLLWGNLVGRALRVYPLSINHCTFSQRRG